MRNSCSKYALLQTARDGLLAALLPPAGLGDGGGLSSAGGLPDALLRGSHRAGQVRLRGDAP